MGSSNILGYLVVIEVRVSRAKSTKVVVSPYPFVP